MSTSFQNESLLEKVTGRDIIFYDGDCLLCHRLVRLMLKVDENEHFLFCSQTSDAGLFLSDACRVSAARLAGIYVVRDCLAGCQQILEGSRAVLYVLSATTKFTRLAAFLSLLPSPLLDLAYRCVAVSRYRICGARNKSCPVAASEDSSRIIA
jgi:predicted DCC family thiol-disulfide oxidoreductase YuxK